MENNEVTETTAEPMDINVIAQNLAELLTGQVEMASMFYDLFLNPEPMDVTFKVYTSDNTLEEVTIPNRAKDRNYALEGTSTPEGSVEAPVGTAYVNTSTGSIYFKVSGSDQFGWTPVLTQTSVIPIITNYLSSRGYATGNSVRSYLESAGYVKVSDTSSPSLYGVVKIDGTSINTNIDGQISSFGLINNNAEESERPLVKVWTGEASDYDDMVPTMTSDDAGTIFILTDTGEIALGKTRICSMAFTSNVEQSGSPTSISSSTTTITATDNGYINFSGTSSSAGEQIKIIKANGQIYQQFAYTSSQTIYLNVPVIKGEVLAIDWTGSIGSISYKLYPTTSITPTES